MEIKVALFEDSKVLRESLEELVNSRDDLLCTGAYSNANQVIRNIQQSKPDVVLMDIDMPGVSGIEAVKLIKTEFPKIQILMQTVFEENDKIFAALCAGASGYLLKKTAPLKMIEAIYETHAGGAPMTASIATKVLDMFRHQSAPVTHEFIDLSQREKEILSLLIKGKSYPAVAKECFISIDTVKTHVKHIYEKLHVHSKSEAVAKAIRQKLV